MHYATDVMTGAAVGAFVGWFVPWLRYSTATTFAAPQTGSLTLSLVPRSDGLGVAGVF